MIHWSAALAPGSRAITSYSGLVLQSDLTRRWTFAGPGPMRVYVALPVAVVPGIGVDEASHRPVLGRDLGLDAAPRAAVARDHDRALDGDPHALELLVVRGNAVVHVHEGPGDVAVRGIGVVGGELLVLLAGGGIAGDGRLLELGDEASGRHELDHPLARGGEQHVERLDLRLPSPLLELREQPLGVRLVVGRAHVVRPGREAAHVRAHAVGARDRLELRLPVALVPGRAGAEPPQLLQRSRCRRDQQGTEDGAHDRQSEGTHTHLVEKETMRADVQPLRNPASGPIVLRSRITEWPRTR